MQELIKILGLMVLSILLASCLPKRNIKKPPKFVACEDTQEGCAQGGGLTREKPSNKPEIEELSPKLDNYKSLSEITVTAECADCVHGQSKSVGCRVEGCANGFAYSSTQPQKLQGVLCDDKTVADLGSLSLKCETTTNDNKVVSQDLGLSKSAVENVNMCVTTAGLGIANISMSIAAEACDGSGHELKLTFSW